MIDLASPAALTNGLILAASAALDDGHLGAVTMDGTDITIQYKSSGRLLYVVPITFPIGISVHAAASTTAERVLLTYPWYKWFVWLTVPEDELIIAIDTAIATAQSQITATTSLKDTQGRLFIGISNALKHAHEEYEQGIRIVL